MNSGGNSIDLVAGRDKKMLNVHHVRFLCGSWFVINWHSHDGDVWQRLLLWVWLVVPRSAKRSPERQKKKPKCTGEVEWWMGNYGGRGEKKQRAGLMPVVCPMILWTNRNFFFSVGYASAHRTERGQSNWVGYLVSNNFSFCFELAIGLKQVFELASYQSYLVGTFSEVTLTARKGRGVAGSAKQIALPIASEFGVCCSDDEGFQCSLAEPVNHVKGINYLTRERSLNAQRNTDPKSCLTKAVPCLLPKAVSVCSGSSHCSWSAGKQ